jgi:hypothetical protein
MVLTGFSKRYKEESRQTGLKTTYCMSLHEAFKTVGSKVQEVATTVLSFGYFITLENRKGDNVF